MTTRRESDQDEPLPVWEYVSPSDRKKKGGEASPVLSLPHEILGEGGYGVVEGPSRKAIQEYIRTHRGIPKRQLIVRKRFHQQENFRDAVQLDKFVATIDPSRIYLKAPVLSSSKSSPVLKMRNQGVDLGAYVAESLPLKPVFEHIHQLLLAIYILNRTRVVHYDIKKENIVVDNRLGVYSTGLIDFDLMTDMDSEEIDNVSDYYYVWPLELYVKRDSDSSDRAIFCAEEQSVMKCTEHMISLWREQCKTIGLLLSDDRDREALVSVGESAIVHANFPEISALRLRVDMYKNWKTPYEKIRLKKVEKLLQWKELGMRLAGAVAIGARDAGGFSRNPVVLAYVRAFFRDSDHLKSKPDWRKIDTFGLGSALIEILLSDAGAFDSLFPSNKRELERDVKRFLFRCVHPDPKKRYDARDALEAWIKIMSMYDPSLVRGIRREMDNAIRDLRKNPRDALTKRKHAKLPPSSPTGKMVRFQ